MTKLVLLSVLISLIHNVMGAFALFFYSVFGLNRKNALIAIVTSLLFFFFLIKGYLPINVDRMIESETARGQGRTIIFLASILYFSIIFSKHGYEKLLFILLSFSVTVIYFMMPFTHRISSVLFSISFFYMSIINRRLDVFVLNIIVMVLGLFGSLYIIYFGLYDYAN